MELSDVPSLSYIIFCHIEPIELSHSHIEESDLIAEPPFQMTECSIDSVNVTKLAYSITPAWSPVVFCIAANLRWLSELGLGRSLV